MAIIKLRYFPPPPQFQFVPFGAVKEKLWPFGWGKIRAVFLGFGFVSAQSQGYSNLLLRPSLAKTQKSSLRTATVFL
jgi:hypothetical protein